MKLRKITFIYLIGYLAIGGLGLTYFPREILDLFLSTGDYGDIMPRMAGMFMCALSYLLFRIYANGDWYYYEDTIYVRTAIVGIMVWFWHSSRDPLFLVLIAIVLIGLIPSIIAHLKLKSN